MSDTTITTNVENQAEKQQIKVTGATMLDTTVTTNAENQAEKQQTKVTEATMLDTAVTINSEEQGEKQQTKVTEATMLDTTVTINSTKEIAEAKERERDETKESNSRRPSTFEFVVILVSSCIWILFCQVLLLFITISYLIQRQIAREIQGCEHGQDAC